MGHAGRNGQGIGYAYPPGGSVSIPGVVRFHSHRGLTRESDGRFVEDADAFGKNQPRGTIGLFPDRRVPNLDIR